MKADFIVCGLIQTEDSYEGRCSKCGTNVYPTIGTHARALREKIPLMCILCFEKTPKEEREFGGFIDHGRVF